jgi:hypothetical protein
MKVIPLWLVTMLSTASLCLTHAAKAQEQSQTLTRTAARGPLRVHPTNPRYFTDGVKAADGSLKAVYLTGSHTWANLIDRGTSDPPPAFDFDAYLDLLEKHDHNFIRLWGRQISWYQKYGEQVLHAAPLAWPRSGPGKALDGKPKFDLTKFDPAYFERLRSRVSAAGNRGIYVSIMLFGGYAENHANWTGSPIHRENNISGIDGDPNDDGSGVEIETLASIPPAVAQIQKAYVKRVIDTVNDLDNVLFEISNEAGGTSKDWQYDMIRFIREYERTQPKQHPIGMTAGYWSASENHEILDASPADWVSYLFEMQPGENERLFDVNNPFEADGRKVSIQDSDHWWVVPLYGNAELGSQWIWKSFCRGHQPILMEHLPPRSFVAADHPVSLDDLGYQAARRAMGQTRRVAERMNLASMTPQKRLASTGYCLAAPGKEYLVYQPKSGEAFSVKLQPGLYQTEWLSPQNDAATEREITNSAGSQQTFTAPFSGPAVLYLKKQ